MHTGFSLCQVESAWGSPKGTLNLESEEKKAESWPEGGVGESSQVLILWGAFFQRTASSQPALGDTAAVLQSWWGAVGPAVGFPGHWGQVPLERSGQYL